MEKNKVKAKTPAKQKTEEELVKEQANRMLRDMLRVHDTGKTDNKQFGKTNVDLWKDTDFFFSIVFQSATQKYEFLKQFTKQFNINIELSDENLIQIINGIELAKSMNICLIKENGKEYPYADLNLRQIALDNEKF